MCKIQSESNLFRKTNFPNYFETEHILLGVIFQTNLFLDPHPVPFSDPLKIEHFFKASKANLGVGISFLVIDYMSIPNPKTYIPNNPNPKTFIPNNPNPKACIPNDPSAKTYIPNNPIPKRISQITQIPKPISQITQIPKPIISQMTPNPKTYISNSANPKTYIPNNPIPDLCPK